MTMVIVRLSGNMRQMYNDPFQLKPFPGEWVIVEADKGEDIAEVVSTIEGYDTMEALSSPAPRILRLANANDLNEYRFNRSKEREARMYYQERIEALSLDMRLIDVVYQLDGHKITFFFIAAERIDFRQLVRDLAARFKTRIELKQIGVRDAAKRLGGFGTCGRELCCSLYLTQFESVTVKMSKDQHLSANSAKISGVCGRLMCCLGYEEDFYLELKEFYPELEAQFNLDGKTYTVTGTDYFNETIELRDEEGEKRTIPLSSYTNLKKSDK